MCIYTHICICMLNNYLQIPGLDNKYIDYFLKIYYELYCTLKLFMYKFYHSKPKYAFLRV